MTWGCQKKTCLLFWPVPNDRNLMCNNEGRFSMSACGISYPTGRICFCKIKWSSISRPLLYLWYKAAVWHWVALRGHALNGEKKAAQASCRKSWLFIPEKKQKTGVLADFPARSSSQFSEIQDLIPHGLQGKLMGTHGFGTRLPKAPSLQRPTLGNRWVLPKKETTGKHWRVGQTCLRSTTFYSWSYINMAVQTNQESWHPSFEDVKKMFQTVGTFSSGLHWKSETI